MIGNYEANFERDPQYNHNPYKSGLNAFPHGITNFSGKDIKNLAMSCSSLSQEHQGKLANGQSPNVHSLVAIPKH